MRFGRSTIAVWAVVYAACGGEASSPDRSLTSDAADGGSPSDAEEDAGAEPGADAADAGPGSDAESTDAPDVEHPDATPGDSGPRAWRSLGPAPTPVSLTRELDTDTHHVLLLY